jgi:hypothetical protein
MRVALLELNVLEAGHFGDGPCPRQDVGAQVDAGDVTIGDGLGEGRGDGARAGIDVQESKVGIVFFHRLHLGKHKGGTVLGGPQFVMDSLSGWVSQLLAWSCALLHYRCGVGRDRRGLESQITQDQEMSQNLTTQVLGSVLGIRKWIGV